MKARKLQLFHKQNKTRVPLPAFSEAVMNTVVKKRTMMEMKCRECKPLLLVDSSDSLINPKMLVSFIFLSFASFLSFVRHTRTHTCIHPSTPPSIRPNPTVSTF